MVSNLQNNKLPKVAMIGPMGSGKTTAAKMLEKYGYEKFAFGDSIRRCFSDVFEPKLKRKLEKAKDRELMQYLGDFVRGKLDMDFEIRYAKENGINDLVFANDLEIWYYDYCQILGYGEKEPTDDFWIRMTIREINTTPSVLNTVIDDMRYLNEAERVTQSGFKIIRVCCEKSLCEQRLLKRDGKFDPKSWDHQSEQENHLIKEDFKVYNNIDLRHLEEQLDQIIGELNAG